MKRYLLFAGSNYYPNGGWRDFVVDADSVEELRTEALKCKWADWSEIVDRDQLSVTEFGGRNVWSPMARQRADEESGR